MNYRLSPIDGPWMSIEQTADFLELDSAEEVTKLLARNELDLPRRFADGDENGVLISPLVVMSLAIFLEKREKALEICRKIKLRELSQRMPVIEMTCSTGAVQ